MDCAQIRDSFVRGALPPHAEVQAHLDTCPHCRELFERDAELGHALASAAAGAVPFPEELFGQLEASVARETGLRAWLRSRPSRVRFAVALISVLLASGASAALARRPDFGDYSDLRLVLLLGSYLAGIVVAFSKELFFSARRASPADYSGLLLAALALPFLVAFAPATEASRAFGPEGALGCFGYGALLTLPTAALLWAFDRDDRLSARTVCLSAAALGLSANLALELHCPSGNAVHLVLGHASVGVVWLAVWAFTRRLSRG